MNKEIEELLNKLKNKAEHYILYDYEVNLLLSYIEQLEKRNKELYEGFMATQEELTDYATKNEQLENNRDKAIKYINEMSGYDVEDYIRQDLLLILKGDSDE